MKDQIKCDCYSASKMGVCGNIAKFKYMATMSITGKKLGIRYVCGIHKKYVEKHFKKKTTKI